jgi:DNA-directed RNA polymerase specialized sigma24 family protein
VAQREQTEARTPGRIDRLRRALGGDRDGEKKNGGEGPGRQTDRAHGAGTVRGALRTAGRLALWAFLALVMARGIGDILAEEPAPRAQAPAETRETFPDTEAQAFAASFARAYLTWQPAEPEALRRRLSEYAAPELVERLVPELPRKGEPQGVLETTIARTQPLGARAVEAAVERLSDAHARLQQHAPARGLPVSESARYLGVSEPTVRAWLRRAVLLRVPEAKPVLVEIESLRRVGRALDELRERGRDRDFTRALVDLLHDRAERHRSEVVEGLDELRRGELEPA